MRQRTLPMVIACLVATAMGCITPTVEVTGEERNLILDYAEPIAENLLQGYNENNYTKYSRDFSLIMIRALAAGEFDEHRQELIDKIGLYISKENPTVLRRGIHVMVIYEAEFEKSSAVTVKVVFVEDDPTHKVDGLWYDSPKLRT